MFRNFTHETANPESRAALRAHAKHADSFDEISPTTTQIRVSPWDV